MSEDDRARWDDRYRDGDWADTGEPARIVKEARRWLRPPGLLLDVACGAGRNAVYLASLGFEVVGVDISWEGLQRLASRRQAEGLPIHLIHADLERFAFPAERFDAIVNTRFLLRSLFPAFREWLKPGGLLIFETYTVDEIEVLGGDIRRVFALERGELRPAFAEFEVHLYEEGIMEEPEGERGLARLIASKPQP